jgi:hypothetical protein
VISLALSHGRAFSEENTMNEFHTGSGTADVSRQPITANHVKAYRFVRGRALAPLFVGNSTVSVDSGFYLGANEELEIPTDSPANVFVVAAAPANYSWLAI